VELNPPFINEPKVKDLPELTIIPPAEIIPPTTFGELPFGFVPIIELPCVVARDKRTGTGSEMFNVDPKNNLVLCDHAPAMYIAPDVYADIQPPKPDQPVELLNALNDVGKEVKKDDRKSDEKSDSNVSQQNFDTSNIEGQFIAEVLPCPPLDTLAKTPIGSLGKGGLARIKGWRRDQITGKCETVWEGLNPLEIAGNYAPPVPLLVSTSAIAVTSILAVGTLQPYIKIVQKQKLFKKKEKIMSLSERRKAQRDLRK
jgi:hypothetical protein